MPAHRDYVEQAVTFYAQMTDIVLYEFHMAYAELFPVGPGAGDIGFPAFDAHHGSALLGELQSLHAFQAAEVQNPQWLETLRCQVTDNLHEAPQF